jgi:hypothetical protein
MFGSGKVRERGISTPFIRIERVEINCLGRLSAVEVLGEQETVLHDIGGRIAHGNLTVTLFGHVSLHISGRCFNPRGGLQTC